MYISVNYPSQSLHTYSHILVYVYLVWSNWNAWKFLGMYHEL